MIRNWLNWKRFWEIDDVSPKNGADTDSSQRVAVKVLSSRLASNPTSVERFRQEGRLASQLVHPRFVTGSRRTSGHPVGHSRASRF